MKFPSLWRRKPRYEEIDPMSFLRRAQAIQTRLGSTMARAERYARGSDIEGLEAAEEEAEFLGEQMRNLRLEQLVAEELGYRREIVEK